MRRQLKPALSRPRDFRAFWDKTLAELARVPAALERRPVEGSPSSELALETISFASLGGVRIVGYFLRGAGSGPRPLVIHSHGYGSECTVQWPWGQAGFDVVGLDIRGFGQSAAALPERSRWGWVMTGAGAPESHVLRGAVCDFLRAIELARGQLAPDAMSTVVYGRSFGGGLAVMAEALLQVADLLVLGVPTLGWAEGRHFFVKDGSGGEINAYCDARPDQMDDLMVVLRYFDTTNFADLIECPALVGVGLEDVVVPAKTVYAIANHLAGPVELMEFPVSHTTRPEEALWDRFEERWETLARDGIPPEFGS